MRRLTAALIVLLLPVSPIRGINVLCIDDIGHVELETAGSSCCLQTTGDGSSTPALADDEESRCGSCNDFFLSCNATRTRDTSLDAHFELPHPATQIVETLPPSLEWSSKDGVPPVAAMTLLRSTVIRC